MTTTMRMRMMTMMRMMIVTMAKTVTLIMLLVIRNLPLSRTGASTQSSANLKGSRREICLCR